MNIKFAFMPLLMAVILLLLSGCYSARKSVERSKPNSEKIDWPANYLPEEASFFVHNEIDIKASPQVVWEILIEAEDWPEWYQGATNVDIKDNDTGKLAEQSIFSWNTMGQSFNATHIKEFVPPYKLGWEATTKNIRGYHAWLIIPTDDGCRVVTSETQHGFLTFMQKVFVPNKLRKLHDVWLAELKVKAEDRVNT